MVEVAMSTKGVEELRKLFASVSPSEACLLVAEAAAEQTRGHLTEVASQRHRSRSRTNFYQRASESVLGESDDGSATITIPHVGMSLRYYGGVVKPSGKVSLATGKPIRKLAIPVEGSEGEVKTTSEFKDIFFCLTKDKKALLVSKQYGPVFHLVDKAEMTPDKTVLPSSDSYILASLEVIQEYVQEKLNLGGNHG